MHRFFTETIFEHGEMIIDKASDVHHMKDVLRMKVGTEIEVSDASGKEYIGEILEISDVIRVKKLSEKDVNRESPVEITLIQGIPKGDKSELIVQKTVELGVGEIIFTPMKRCVAKFDDKKREKKKVRLQRIADEAAKQSKRTRIPDVDIVSSLDLLINRIAEFDLVIIPYEVHDETNKISAALSRVEKVKKIAVVIGPEGGFDESEIEKLQLIGGTTVSVGPRIMRTETAGLATISCIQVLLGDF